MRLKRRLINTLPDSLKRALAVPYDVLQTARADREFRRKRITDRRPAADGPRHIVWVVVDALRSDAVEPAVTPFLASLDGTTDAVAPAPWTFPSVTSMLTGTYPHEHGSMRADTPSEAGLSLPPKLDPEAETLTEVLAGAGFRTYGGFGHDTPFVALSGRFHHHSLFHNLTASAKEVLTDYHDWRTSTDADRTFGYVHLADPHQPVDPPAEYWTRHEVDAAIPDIRTWRYREGSESPAATRYREHRRRLYRATVDYVDDQLADFHDRLPDDTVLVVTADHGEAHWEHTAFDFERFDGTGSVDHGGTPYEAVARVPLLFEGIDLTVDGYVSLVDLVPTFLETLGLHQALRTTGQSLFDPIPDDRVPLIEGTMNGTEKKAVYQGSWKLIAAPDAEAWFELPSEREVVPPGDVAEALTDALPGWDGAAQGTEVSGLVEQRLKDLGYK